MGYGKSIPSSNDTRWNSIFKQLHSFLSLDGGLWNEVLNDKNHQNLILSAKNGAIKRAVNILNPFAEATDLTRENSVSLICAVPIIIYSMP